MAMTNVMSVHAGVSMWDTRPMRRATGLSNMDLYLLLCTLMVPLAGNIFAMHLMGKNYR